MNLASLRRIDPSGQKGPTVYFSEIDSLALAEADAETLVKALYVQNPPSPAQRVLLSRAGKTVIFWIVILTSVLLVYLALQSVHR